MEHLTQSKKSEKPLRTKDIISEVIMMKHLIQLSRLQQIRRKQQKSNKAADRKSQITRHILVWSGKEVFLKTKGTGHHLLKKRRRRNRKLKWTISSKNPVSFQMVITVKELHQQNQCIRHLQKPAIMIEKEQIKGMARLQKKWNDYHKFIFQEEEM